MRTYVIPMSIKRRLEREAEKLSAKGLKFRVCTRVIQVYYLGHFICNINFTRDFYGNPVFRTPLSHSLLKFKYNPSFSGHHKLINKMIDRADWFVACEGCYG